jgi:hypothetical protein
VEHRRNILISDGTSSGKKYPVDRLGCVHFRPGSACTDQGHIRSPNDQAQPGAI